jgi:RNase adapter protein RapZ
MSFGYRYGLPVDADLVFDVRFLPNPYFEPDLRLLTGLEAPVSAFVLGQEETVELLRRCVEMLDFLIPLYKREGKSYLTVAIGCTGGQHRSVAVCEELAHRLQTPHSVNVLHRDIVRHMASAEDCQEVTQ